jgi:simple sugar transport system permease protein
MIRLQKRAVPSRAMIVASPLIACAATIVTGLLLFKLLGKDPLQGFHVYFVKPLETRYGLGEWILKATPLILCALGLAIGFRANVWNIGAEGQLTLGAIGGGGVALAFPEANAWVLLPAMLVAGAAAGMAWAAIPAFLRTRFNTSEILVSLMLVYIAGLLLAWLVHGPWRDPAGYNFPQSKMFSESATLPLLLEGTRAHWGFVLALALALASWVFSQVSFAGFRMQVSGLAPAAAAYAGFSEKRSIWLALLTSGATAGLAGVCEVAGPIGQLHPTVSPGYGFAAIIVAFVGRLHPVGIVLGALLMSLFYLGGETAQIDLALPSAITGLFQGLLLFYLLAADLFITYRLVGTSPTRPHAAAAPSVAAGTSA